MCVYSYITFVFYEIIGTDMGGMQCIFNMREDTAWYR